MIHYKSEEEIELIRESSLLVGKTLSEVAKLIKTGIETKLLDKVAEEFIRDNRAIPGFKGYNGFPNTLCISINEEVVHGFPGKKILNEGDIVSVDCGVIKNGYYGDSAYTFAVGDVDEAKLNLVEVTKQSLYKGLEVAIEGKRIGDIGFEIQNFVESFNYSVVRDLVGHGIGKKLHEKPEVPNYGKKGTGLKLTTGLVIAIEPMINLGKKDVVQSKDGWTIFTADRMPSAHFEHTVAIRKGKVDILSSFDEIEIVLKNNINIKY